jgi:hypothetical protein
MALDEIVCLLVLSIVISVPYWGTGLIGSMVLDVGALDCSKHRNRCARKACFVLPWRPAPAAAMASAVTSRHLGLRARRLS